MASGDPIDIDAIIRYEDGDLDEEETVRLFQSLIDSGHAWHMQGAYGRTAAHLIHIGKCLLPPVAQKDYYGNRIPSRHEVPHDV